MMIFSNVFNMQNKCIKIKIVMFNWKKKLIFRAV